jgi:predicted component of type VI protein secretion system
MSDAIGTTTKTLHALSTRLSRLEFVLTGGPSPPPPTTGSEQPIRVRIRALHTDLQRLQAKSRTVAEILQIRSSPSPPPLSLLPR